MSLSSHSDHGDACLDDSDADSETSTVAYSHESFVTYQTRVLDLLCGLYGSQIAKSSQITRLPGGAFNRIVGIALFVARSSLGSNIGIPVSDFNVNANAQDLILRIPRDDHTDMAVQVNLLKALISSLPVPEIRHYDPGSNNPLGQPYILMQRLPGQTLSETLLDMTTKERCDIAKQVAQLIVKIHEVPVPPGIGPLSAKDTGKISVGQFSVNSQDWFENPVNRNKFSTVSTAATFHSFVSTRIAQFRVPAHQRVPPDTFILELLDRFSSASSALLDAYVHPHCPVLFHRDFAARNLLALHDTVRARWSIAGVLDWDEAESAPLEIASIWPSWLWASDQKDESDFEDSKWDPDLPVPDDKSGCIKKSFIDEIEKLEPRFVESVRRARDGCLRLVYERARQGFWSNEHVKDLDRIEEAAKKLSISDMAKLSLTSQCLGS